MELELLKIYTLSADGASYSAFPSASSQIEITSYTYTSSRMGTTSVSATVKWPVCLDSAWTGREFVVMNESSLSGNDTVLSLEKFFLLHRPGSAKGSDDERYVHTLEFQSERDVVLSSVYFLDAVSDQAASADRFQSNNYNVKFYGKLSEFVGRFNDVLTYMGLNSRFSVVIDAGVAATEDREVSFEKATLFEALQAVYDVWDVPFYFEGNVIHFGEGNTIVPQVSFQYGSDRELLSVEKNNTNAKIVTRCSGYGSTDNIPHYYPNPTAKGTLKAKYNNTWSTDSGSPIAITSQKKFAAGLDLNDSLTYTGTGASDKLSTVEWNGSVVSGTEENPTTAFIDVVGMRCDPSGMSFRGTCRFGLNGMFRGEVSIIPTFAFYPAPDASTENIWIMKNVTNPTNRDIVSGRPATEVAERGWAINVNAVRATFTDPNDATNTVTKEIPYSAFYTAEKVYNEWYTGKQEKEYDKYFATKQLKYITVDMGGVIDLLFSDFCEEVPNAVVTISCLMKIYTCYSWFYYDETYSKYLKAIIRSSLSLACTWTEGGWKYGSKGHSDNISNLSDIGLSYTGTPALNDVIKQGVLKYVKPSEYLMPSIYRDTDGAVRYLNASDTQYVAYTKSDGTQVTRGHYPIPGTSPQRYYTFPNIYNSRSPREHIEEFSDIMPTVRNLVDGQGNALNVFSNVFFEDGYNVNETTTDDKLKYNYFFVKLKALGFNLFNSASASGEMTFSMLDGDCGGCQFKVVVNDKQQNPVVTDANGNLVIDATTKRVKMVDGDVVAAQQDTTSNQVWVALYLDSSTYGGTEVEMGVMPNYDKNTGKGQKPVTGDKYTILNIDLPDSYILAAETKLEQEIVKFMSENNDEKYSFNIKFSRVYLAQNPAVRALLNEHCALNLTYNGTQLAAPLHVSQYTYKANEGESLPEISVELSDVIEIPSSGLEQKISAGVKDVVNVVRGYGSSTEELDSRYARKDVDDVFMGVPTFKNGFVAGESGRMSVNASGEAILDVDYLNVSKKAVFSQIEIDRLRQVGGRVLLSLASLKCSAVETLSSNSTITGYKCYFSTTGDDGDAIVNEFVVGDLAICQTFGTTATKYYWRKVIARGDDYITLSNVSGEFDGTDVPSAGDEIVQLGNVSDTGRQAAQILSCTGTDSPSLIAYVGISSPTLANRDIYGFKYTASGSTYLPYLFNYGSMLLGDRAKTNDYVEYNHTNGLMTIKANVVFKAGQSLVGIDDFDDLSDEVDEVSDSLTGWPAVKAALVGETVISGGLVLSQMIQLGQKSGSVFSVKAGISGIYNASKTGGGIAGWYGGNMWDLEHLGSGETAAGAAKSLFRFDGTGYLASGKITWDADGYGQLGGANDDYVIKWDNNGVQLGKNIKIGTESETLNTMLQHITDRSSNPHNVTWSKVASKSSQLATPEYIQTAYIGDGQVTLAKLAQGVQDILDLFEKDTTSVEGQTLIHAKYALYSHEEITAGGIGSGGGGGGSVVTWNQITGASGNTHIADITINGSIIPVYAPSGGSGVTAFNDLTGRPQYNGTAMTSSTNIPVVPTAVSQLTNDSGYVNNQGAITACTGTFLPIAGGIANTNTNTTPFYISRGGYTDEALAIGVDDATAKFNHIQDETVSNYEFKGTWTDTESGGGARAGSNSVVFGLGYGAAYITVGGNTVYHTGNLSPLTTTNYSSYCLPLTGGTITGDTDALIIRRNGTGYSAITYYNNNGLLGVLGYSSSGEPSTYQVSNNTWYTIYHSGNCNNTSTPWSASTLTLNGAISAVHTYQSYGFYVYPGGENYAFRIASILNNQWGNWLVAATSSGNVGIGTTSPQAKLDVNGGAHFGGSLEINADGSSWNEGIRIHPASNWSGIVFCESSNSGSSGTSANTWSIHNNEGVFGMYKNGSNIYSAAAYISHNGNWMIGGGNVTCSSNLIANGEITAGSDRRWKHDIEPLKDGIEYIKKLNPCLFMWNEDKGGNPSAGLIAQEAEEVLGERIVRKDEQGYLHLNYDGLHAFEISAIQSHETRIEALERENAELKNTIARLTMNS